MGGPAAVGAAGALLDPHALFYMFKKTLLMKWPAYFPEVRTRIHFRLASSLSEVQVCLIDDQREGQHRLKGAEPSHSRS